MQITTGINVYLIIKIMGMPFPQPYVWITFPLLCGNIFYSKKVEEMPFPLDSLIFILWIYSHMDFSFIFSLIYNDFLMNLLKNFRVKPPHFVPQSIIFSRGQCKYHFFTQKMWKCQISPIPSGLLDLRWGLFLYEKLFSVVNTSS